MITYYLNMMGPVKKSFIEKYGDDWAGGRIDIHLPDKEYNDEYPMEFIKIKDWRKLGAWIWNLETESVLSKEEILSRYEKETGNKIEYLVRGD